MTDELTEWKAWKDMPRVYTSMGDLVYTECGLGRTQTYVRVMVKVDYDGRRGAVELFRAPVRTSIDLNTGEARALFLDDWFAAMRDSAATYFAIQALKEPL